MSIAMGIRISRKGTPMGLCPIIMVAAMAWRRSFRPDQLFQSYSTFGAPPLYLSIRRPLVAWA
ncbi:hypothetical protein [Sphingobium sp. BS19]|uniref:hypothetical protein n=1 Tax=Sphingobium sp. BS19 TaxID=3018973 RepID=UPI00248F9E9B|nr:hypothetical protein [Sphingobium sp. BS19]